MIIKIENKRKSGYMFHYAHFICDCLFTEIVNDIFNYDKIIRKKTLHQTIGNFHKIYTDITNTENIELVEDEYNDYPGDIICFKKKEDYSNKYYFDKFRNFIFSKYKINNLIYLDDYPEVILIKRGDRIKLINDDYLSKLDNKKEMWWCVSTGKERREIVDIDNVENYLKKKYKNKFKSVYFENVPFEKQVLYFNNAKLIICVHGAVLSNMFFCKEQTTIIEVFPKITPFPFFDKISNILNLKHIKCNNTYDNIIDCIDANTILI